MNINEVLSAPQLSQNQMKETILSMMSGAWSDDQIITFLTNLSNRGETIEEITGAALALRDKVSPVKAPEGAIDCCGTGGDNSGTYNISTAVALTAAACGIPMAKHGNRSASSKSGAADVLEALGCNLNVPQEKLEEALRLYNFAFLMAPRHHQAMKHVMPARKAMKTRTIFNILGPLANPASTKRQLLGVFSKDLIVPLANVLKNIGTEKAWVVHGSDGLDEITTTGETYIAVLENGAVTEKTISPEEFGIPLADSKDLIGGSPQENAEALLDVLKGSHNAYRNIVVINTAALLMIANKETDPKHAAHIASLALDNGSTHTLLDRYAAFTQEFGE